MYQPEDGITAYECVLKKAQEYLTNCDYHKKQLLLSMIPVPNNASNHAIKNIFRVTTGFTKLSLNEKNILQNIFDIKIMDRTMDSISPSKQDCLYNNNVSNFKLSLCEGFPFRGFPENEIPTIPNNVKSVNYLLDKKCDPTKIDSTESCLSYSSRQADTCSLKTYNNATITNFCHDKISRQPNNVKLEKSEDINAFNKDKNSGISQIIIDVRQNAIIKQTIKDNTYQMDVCLDGDENVVVDADDLMAITRDRLKASLKNFLKRAQDGTVVELSAFPRTKSYPQMGALNSVCFTSKERKSETPHKVLKKDSTSQISNISNGDNGLLSKRQNININLEEIQRVSDEKMKRKAFNYVTGLQMKNDPQEFSKATELQKNNLEPSTIERKQDDTEKFMCKMAGSRPNDVNPEKDFQAHSMSELAAYKKRYYDTLLNIQRAKVAVTNSLACSSDHLTACNDPYYANYMCQQKHLFHQQRHFAARPQFSSCPTALSGLSSDQYSWTRPDCKYLLLKQLRLQRQASPLYTHNQDGWIHSYNGPVYPYPLMSNGNSRTKHCVRRKDLESLVGNFDGTERAHIYSVSVT
ncbi:hypothetical protein DMN91_005419 [Ooceraea biroi]|uniref:Uncharacterized protein n=2 Tax=Ooceraea biroi TaxID=2015173 RepID=A0A3L8DRW5_OOCBI|nr:hypothetical protein DMN91_005419 [Ooceraea biroi]